MKIIFMNVFLLLLMSFASCQSNQKFKKVPESEINKNNLLLATQLSDKIMAAQKEGGFYQLTKEEAESRMINAFSETVQKQSYEQIQGLFGDYNSLVFNQLMKPTDGTLYEIYRFIGEFEVTEINVEIRVVLNSKGKLAGFFIKPWNDEI